MKKRQPSVIADVECWQCSACRKWFPPEGFYPSKKAWNGLKTQCKKCHGECQARTRNHENACRLRRESAARAVAARPDEMRAKWRESSRARTRGPKDRARYALNLAVSRGVVERPSVCGRCGQPGKLEAHHFDYSRALDVEWLCTLCHGREHRKPRRIEFERENVQEVSNGR